MRYTFGATTVEILGDPHLGRRFHSGVPLHRRGERERSQWQSFADSLDRVDGARVHVNLGDLFDRYVVPPEVVLRAAFAYRRAAAAHPGTDYVILMGNHDASRDVDRKSSFDLFSELVRGSDNITVVAPEVAAVLRLPDGPRFGFCSWHPFRDAADVATELPHDAYDAVFGHWDLESFGRDDHNLIPIDALKTRTATVVTGHVHLPEVRTDGGLTVHVVGAMQPYAHGEDRDGALYVTRTLDEVLAADAGAFKDKCLRVVLKPGEELPEVDCLQLTPQRVTATGEAAGLDVVIEDFDFEKVFRDVLGEEGVDAVTVAEVWSLYQDLRADTVVE